MESTGHLLYYRYRRDLCQDCGESALAKTVELWGRLSLVLLSLPLLETLLRTVTEVLS